MGKIDVNREEELRKRFNKAINSIVSLDVDDDKNYYDALSAKEFINLKKALGNINNIITLKTTLAFVDKLASYNLIEGSVVEQIKEKINSQSANANGFDILCEEGDFPFVAEVKCNIPVEKDKFGPAQLGGIYKDIINLSQGKGKVDVDVTEFNKFMVFLDCDKIEVAIKNLIDTWPKYDSYYVKGLVSDQESLDAIWGNIEIVDLDTKQQLELDKIYICVVPV